MAKKDKDKEKESSIIETREQELPEVDIVGKSPKREIVTPTEGKVEAPEQIAPVPVYTTPVEQPRVEASAPRHQRDVNFGEGLAKIASVMGIGQGDGGRDRVAAREQRAADRRERQDARQDARQARQEARDARQDARQAVRDERQALRDARVAENRENRLNAQQVRRDARDVARMEREQSRLDARQVRDAARQVRQDERDASRQVRVDDRLARRDERMEARDVNRMVRRDEAAKERAARVEEIARRRGARVERQEVRDERREARVADRQTARQDRREARQGERASRMEENVGLLTGKPQGLRRLDAPTTDAPTEMAAPADKAPAAKTYGVTKIEEPNVQRRPSGEGGTTAEQREITDAEARTGRESAAANGQGAERKVTYIEEPNVQRRPHVDDKVVVTEDKPITDEEARKIRGYGDNVVDHTTAREIPKAISVYDIEKERQAKRDAEKDIADYDAKEYVRVVDSLKPKHDPVEWKEEEVPIIEDIEEEVLPGNKEAIEDVAEEAKKADDPLAFLTQLASQYSDEDRRADEKKKKAAQWILAAQMLGDSIGALSNVYWTGKGANAMKFEPGAQKAAAATYQLEQDIRNAREKAAKAQYDAALKKYELEMQKAKEERAQANADRLFEYNKAKDAQQQKNFEKTEARLAEQARLNAENERIRIDIAKQNANIQLKNALDKNKPYPMAVNGEIYEIPIKKINEQIIGSIFAKLPEEVRMSAGQPIYDTDLAGNPIIKGYKNPSLADMLAAIGTYGNEETAKEIMKLAGVKVEEAETANTEAPKSAVVKDAYGNEYSVNPDSPVLGAASSSMQTDEAKKHLDGIVISTGKKPVWQ